MATDNFNRADETPIASPWVIPAFLNNINLASNQARRAVTDLLCGCYYDDTWSNDQTSECTVQVSANDFEGMGPATRLNATTGYFAVYSPGHVDLYRFTGTGQGYQLLVSDANTVVDGDLGFLSSDGTTHICELNDAEVINTTDANIASGEPGLVGNEGGHPVTESAVDDWEGLDIPEPPPAITPKTSKKMFGWGVGFA